VNKLRILLTGGGTGGHIYPALAIARGLQTKIPTAEFLYVGTSNGLEADIVPQEGLSFRTITVIGLERHFSWQTLKASTKLFKGVYDAWRILGEFQPALVIGTGGYVCAPVALAAILRRIPLVLHEQNALPGITNRLLARFARAVCVTFPEATKYFPKKTVTRLTGLPIRPEILALDRDTGATRLEVDGRLFCVLVLGGSRGAKRINEAMIEVYRELAGMPDVHFYHVTGQLGYRETMNQLELAGIDLAKCGNITIKPYQYDMASALAVADLVVGRAGATFIAEITAKGIPSILIPYPYAAENHQEHNARALERQGAAVVVLDRELSGATLSGVIKQMRVNSIRLEEMALQAKRLGQPRALEAIMKVIFDLVKC
jgi:UDP-N-acetylglucosamine--N-acetylmuramyl-(pentapeptide) pyrophosphoryl-undecaprenol N-acetylglucosamine transferase